MLHGSDHFFFFFNDTATTEIYTLSLHDALPISPMTTALRQRPVASSRARVSSMVRNPKTPGSRLPSSRRTPVIGGDRKSTRLNSSHPNISYAVFCLKKKKIVRAHDCTLVTPISR